MLVGDSEQVALPELRPVTKAQLKAFETILLSLGSVAAVAVFVFEPVQRFADYTALVSAGIVVMAALALAFTMRLFRPTVTSFVAIGVSLAGAGIVLGKVGRDALTRSDYNDRRCLRIQIAMLRPTPTTRQDLPALFSALGCRPQGISSVEYPAQLRWSRSPMPPEIVQRYEAEVDRALAAEVPLNATAPKD